MDLCPFNSLLTFFHSLNNRYEFAKKINKLGQWFKCQTSVSTQVTRILLSTHTQRISSLLYPLIAIEFPILAMPSYIILTLPCWHLTMHTKIIIINSTTHTLRDLNFAMHGNAHRVLTLPMPTPYYSYDEKKLTLSTYHAHLKC